MAITFNQVANPNFADSNKLLEIALAQSAKATEGLQGTLGKVVTNVEDNNLAKIRQLVDSQTREQLTDPAHQDLMNKQIESLVASTGNTYDPLKVQDYTNKRVESLQGREVTDSNLNSARITQEGNVLANNHTAAINPLLQASAQRKNTAEQNSTTAMSLKGDMQYFDKTSKTLDAAIASETDPTKLASLKERRAVVETDRDAAFAKYGDISPDVMNQAFALLDAEDVASQKRKLDELNVLSQIDTRATNNVNNTAKTGAYVAQVDAGILNNAALTDIQREKLNKVGSSGFSAPVKEAKSTLIAHNIDPSTVGADGTINYKSYANQMQSNANKDASAATGDDGTSYLDYASSLGKNNTISTNQMRDLQQVFEGRNIPDYQKKAFLKELQIDSSKAKNWYSNKGAIEKSLGTFIEDYTTSGAGRLQEDAKKASYQNGISGLIALGNSPEDVVKNLSLTDKHPDMYLMPKEIQDAVGFSLTKYREQQKNKGANSNQHTAKAAKDFAAHEKEWAQKDKTKTARQKLVTSLGDEQSSLSPFEAVFGDSMQNSTNELLRRLRGN